MRYLVFSVVFGLFVGGGDLTIVFTFSVVRFTASNYPYGIFTFSFKPHIVCGRLLVRFPVESD